MIGKVFDAVFGCRHSHYSFPITLRHSSIEAAVPAADLTGTYVACLDCGKELPYDWRQMKVVSLPSAPSGGTALAQNRAA
jgi:hypothetical protein